MKRKTDHKRVPREEELAIELSEDGQRRFTEMTEQPPIPGAAKRRIAREEGELAKSHDKRLAAARGLAQPAV